LCCVCAANGDEGGESQPQIELHIQGQNGGGNGSNASTPADDNNGHQQQQQMMVLDTPEPPLGIIPLSTPQLPTTLKILQIFFTQQSGHC